MATGKTNAAGGRGFKYGEKIVVSEDTANTFIKHGYGHKRLPRKGKLAENDYRYNLHNIIGYFPSVDKLVVTKGNSVIDVLNIDTFEVETSFSINVSSLIDHKRGRLYCYHNNSRGYYDLKTRSFVSLFSPNGVISYDHKYIYSLTQNSNYTYTLKVFDVETPSKTLYSQTFNRPPNSNNIECCLTLDLPSKICTFASRNGITKINLETLEIVSEQGKDVWVPTSYEGFSDNLKTCLITTKKYSSYNETTTLQVISYNVETEKIEKTYSISFSKISQGYNNYGSAKVKFLSDGVVLVFIGVSGGANVNDWYIYHRIHDYLIDYKMYTYSIESPKDNRYLVFQAYDTFTRFDMRYIYGKDDLLYSTLGETYNTSLQLTNTLTWNEND